MRFYQRQQLISLQDLLVAYQAVLGPEVGLSLLAGARWRSGRPFRPGFSRRDWRKRLRASGRGSG